MRLPSIALQYYCNHSAARQGDYFFLSTIALTMTIVKEISVKVNIEKSNTRLNVSYVTISTTSFPEDWRVVNHTCSIRLPQRFCLLALLKACGIYIIRIELCYVVYLFFLILPALKPAFNRNKLPLL